MQARIKWVQVPISSMSCYEFSVVQTVLTNCSKLTYAKFHAICRNSFPFRGGGGGEIGKLRKRQNIGKMRVGGGQFKGG